MKSLNIPRKNYKENGCQVDLSFTHTKLPILWKIQIGIALL